MTVFVHVTPIFLFTEIFISESGLLYSSTTFPEIICENPQGYQGQ